MSIEKKKVRMVLKYDRNDVWISNGELSMQPRYYKDSNFYPNAVDVIHNAKYNVSFRKKDLPPDVKMMTSNYYSDDNVDQAG